MRVLYVEDDRLNTLLFEAACEAAGDIELRCAETGAQALASLGDFQPDALVIDLHLPDTDGCDLLRSLRHALGTRPVTAWLCSADPAHELQPMALDAGFFGCLDKPVDLMTIRRLQSEGPAA